MEGFAAVVHVAREPGGQLPVDVILTAYRASRDAPVMLVLDSVSPREVDEILNPMVVTMGLEVCGVRYTQGV